MQFLRSKGGAAIANSAIRTVNERRVSEPTSLADGDRIRFGRVLVTYRQAIPAFTTERISAE